GTRPDHRARGSLAEPGGVEEDDRVTEPEDQAGDPEQAEAADHRPPRPDPRREDPRRQGHGQRPRRGGALEDPGFRTAEVEFGDVMRKQRSDRRVERDVEENHRRGEDEQPSHHSIQSPTLTRLPPEGWQSG